jgi:hypothetical protein
VETEFPAGLTRVKAKTLSKIGSGSRVRSGQGQGQVTGLRLFPYPGAIGLTGLGRIMARVTGLRHFSYQGRLG